MKFEAKTSRGGELRTQKNVGIHHFQWLIYYKVNGAFALMSIMNGFKSMENLLSICMFQESEKKVGLSRRKKLFL